MQFKKIGILGGGQLGRMLCLGARHMDIPIFILDQDPSFSAGTLANQFHTGDFTNYEDVIRFGRKVDILTIEIEKINTEALHLLQSEGIIIHPNPRAIEIIADKGLQKHFYQNHNFPTSSFILTNGRSEVISLIHTGRIKFPFVQKVRKGGYDGRGVAVINTEKDLDKLMDTPSVIEDKVDIQKEVAVIVARNSDGEIKAYDPVAMHFVPEANLVDYLYCPAGLSPKHIHECKQIATTLIEAFDICGLLAIEFFVDSRDSILINEVAPRPHNSGHHTIEAAHTSQFEQHIRAIHNLPLGSTKSISPAVMVNILGAEGYTGIPEYQGLEKVLAIPDVHVHLYGKTITKPDRKMGHITILDPDLNEALEKVKMIRKYLKVISLS